MLVEYTEQDLQEHKNNQSDIYRQPTDLSVPRTSLEGSFFKIKETNSYNKQCRICLEDEAEAPNKLLICPCKCSGSIKYVHECCMKKWLFSALAIKTNQQRIRIQRNKGVQCQMCKDTIKFRLYYQFNCQTYDEVINTMLQKEMLSVIFLILIIVALIGIGFAAFSISKGEKEFVGKDGVNIDFVLTFSGIILLVFFVLMALYAFAIEFLVKKTLMIDNIGEQNLLSSTRLSSNSKSNQISNVWEHS